MDNSERYVIVIEPENSVKEVVESFRMERIGQRSVDNLVPHISFKRGFFISEGFSEKDIVDVVEGFKMPVQKVVFDRIEKFGDAVVLTTDSVELKKHHKEFIKLIDSKVISPKPEWEGDGFNPHMTLYRDSSDRSFENDMIIKEAVFDKISLYEIDPTPNRSFAKLIFTKKLES